MLQFALPIGKGFPDWRNGSGEDLQFRLSGPLDGISFDVEHAGFWLPDWSPKPVDRVLRFQIARQAIERAPRLIPVYPHRYIPAEPLEAGSPIFSVHQTDIINYGNDLASYFHKEFRVPLPDWAATEPRPIRFWSDAVRGWNDELCHL